MKQINLKNEIEIIKINGVDTEVPLKTTDLLKMSINTPVEGGYSITDLSSRLKLLDKVSTSESNNQKLLILEDSEFSELSKIVRSTKWNILSKKILEFVQLFN